MSTTPPIVKGKKARAELTEGLPSKIRLILDWDGACDLTANRRNCIIHRALMHKDEITRPTVGTDKITFIWRGDARIEVIPNSYALRELLRNDEASQGLRDWPTGQQTLYLPLEHIVVRDLRPAREAERERRAKMSDEERAERNAKDREWRSKNPEKMRAGNRSYRARQKKAARTKVERGRFILS